MRKFSFYEEVYKGCRIQFTPEDDPSNPRRSGWGNLATLYCWHRDSDLGDATKFSDDEKRDIITTLLDKRFPDRKASSNADAKLFAQHYFMRPLYLYEHGGMTISTSSSICTCRWDSGQVGWAVVDIRDARKEWRLPTEARWDTTIKREGMEQTLEGWASEMIDAETWVYDQYLRGNVAFREILVIDEDTDEDDWESLESLGDIFPDRDGSYTEHTKEARAIVDYWVTEKQKEAEQRALLAD